MIDRVNPLRHPKIYCLSFLAYALLVIGCLHAQKGIDISTNGFISDSCYQAVVTIEPDDPQGGLVDRRDSAYMKAQASPIRQLALENLADYCIAMKGKTTLAGKTYSVDSRAELMAILSTIVPHGETAFVYFNERGAAVIGYQFCRVNLQKKIDSLINPQNEYTISSDQGVGGKQ